MEISKWDNFFLTMAKHISLLSKDPSTKCGAVITNNRRVVSMGFNGLPQGVSDETRRYSDRSVKYSCIIHAEENALLFCTERLTSDHVIYTYPCPPCSSCAGKIIQSGIRTVVSPVPFTDIVKRFEDSFALAKEFYEEARVNFILLDFK